MSDRTHVFVYCDSSEHPGRTFKVWNFARSTWGAWASDFQPLRERGDYYGHDAVVLIGDDVAQSGWALDPAVSNSDVRERLHLTCTATGCRSSVTVRHEELGPVLDAWAAAGQTRISLHALGIALGASEAGKVLASSVSTEDFSTPLPSTT